MRRERDRQHRAAWRRKNPGTELPERAEALALTVAGGVSLGSYEAGQVYMLTFALQSSPDSAQLKVVTGASAGGANAVIAGTTACLPPTNNPEDALGYKVWVNSGLDQLFEPDRTTPRSLFVKDSLVTGYQRIADTWRRGLPKTCDFAFGVAGTREKGYDVHLAEGLVVPRQTEHFVVHVQGRGDGTAPAFHNYVNPDKVFERPLLPLTDGADATGKPDIVAIQQAIVASASFPVAFEPQPVEHCITQRRTGPSEGAHSAAHPPSCDVATRVDLFVDGGVFDNNPLGSAYDIARDGLVQTDSGPRLRPVPVDGPDKRPELVYGYIDPDLRTYTIYKPPSGEEKAKDDPLLSLLGKLGGQALSTARGRELATLAERNSTALHRLWLLQASYPPISELLAAFFGFFERDFRDFDFHMGAYDTYRELRDNSGSMLGVDPFLDRASATLDGPLVQIPPHLKKVACILAHAEPDRHGRLRPLCDGPELRNFRVLLQVTIDRLWSNCRLLEDAQVTNREHLQCKRARGGIAAPQVDPSFHVSGERYRGELESEFDYVMRELDDYKFHFKDLKLDPEDADLGRRAIRKKLVEMVDAIADAQPGFTDRTLVLTAGRALANGIEYEPPPQRVYASFGSAFSLGYLGRVGELSYLYWNPDARVHNVRTLLTDRPDEFAATASLGAELALLPISGTMLQFSVGARAGYHFSAEDSIGVDPCNATEAASDSRNCSQFVIHTPASMTFLERVRVTLTPVWFPFGESWGHNIFDLEASVGAEFF